MKKCLIIEDVADAQLWLSNALNEAYSSVSVDVASTLGEAKDYVSKSIYAIALVDLNLPDGSGVDLIRHLRTLNPETLCVVVTIYDDDQHLFPALQAGAQGYLLKEQPRSQLMQRLKGIEQGEPPLSPAIARRLLTHFGNLTPAPNIYLTDREIEVLTLIAKGIKLPEVSTMLNISRNTAAGYVKEIYRKLNVSSRAEVALEAARLGLIKPN